MFLVLPHSRPSISLSMAMPVTWQFAQPDAAHAPTSESKDQEPEQSCRKWGLGWEQPFPSPRLGIRSVKDCQTFLGGHHGAGTGSGSTVISPGSAVEQLCASSRQLS